MINEKKRIVIKKRGSTLTSRDFVHWLQGFAELNKEAPTGEQWESIKKHLSLVFVHEIDPSMGGKQHQEKLNNIHGGSSSGPPVFRC